MGKAETYDELIFQLGDIARERLPNKVSCPNSMQRVFRAEEALVARQDELAALEQQMNDEEANYDEWLAWLAAERETHGAVVKRYKKAVDTIEGRVKELRKKVATRKADHRYGALGLEKEEKKLADLEMAATDGARLEDARQNMKKLRLAHMRLTREIEQLEADLARVLTPAPGQPGADGILAHKRMLELQDEADGRKEEYEALMKDLDQAIAQKEQEVAAAEDYLDQALFLLGEECYATRIPDPALAALYPKLDKVR